jgi:hypothetical protein
LILVMAQRIAQFFYLLNYSFNALQRIRLPLLVIGI